MKSCAPSWTVPETAEYARILAISFLMTTGQPNALFSGNTALPLDQTLVKLRQLGVPTQSRVFKGVYHR